MKADCTSTLKRRRPRLKKRNNKTSPLATDTEKTFNQNRPDQQPVHRRATRQDTPRTTRRETIRRSRAYHCTARGMATRPRTTIVRTRRRTIAARPRCTLSQHKRQPKASVGQDGTRGRSARLPDAPFERGRCVRLPHANGQSARLPNAPFERG